MAGARVPEARRTALTKPEIAIEEINRVIASAIAELHDSVGHDLTQLLNGA